MLQVAATVLNTAIKGNDYPPFKKNRVKNFEKTVPCNDVLKPLAEALNKFLSDFKKFDDKGILKGQ